MATKAHSYLFLYIGAFVLMLFLVIAASKTIEHFTEKQILANNKLTVTNRATLPSIFNPNKQVVRQLMNANKKNKRERGGKPLSDEVVKPESTLDIAKPTTTVLTNTTLPAQTYLGPPGSYESIGSDGKITIKPVPKGVFARDNLSAFSALG